MTVLADLGAWDAASDDVRAFSARRSAKRAGLAFDGLETFGQGGQRHAIGIAAGDDVRWALIPGGTATLGYEPGSFSPTPDQLASLAWAQAEWDVPPLESLLAMSLAPLRTVRLQPIWIEIHARPVGTNERGVFVDRPMAPSACRPSTTDRWRLPTADEWEWACRAGTQTLFRWGDEYPAAADMDDRSVTTDDERVNAFGLLIASNPYDWEVTAEGNVLVGGDGGSTRCGGNGEFLGWLPLASAWRELVDPDKETFGLHRRRCLDALGAGRVTRT